MQLSFVINQRNGFFHAGTELTGKLIIKSTKPVTAQNLSLYFRGKEYTEVSYQDQQTNYNADGTTSYHSVTRTARDKHQFMRVEIPVATHLKSALLQKNGRTIPGTHEIPFRFVLPSDLPSTVSVSKGRDNAKIEYCIRAKLLGSGVLVDYQARQPINVSAKSHLVEPVPCILRPKTQGINSMGMFSKGDISYGARISSKIVVPGQILETKVALLNNSKENIEFVKFRLLENTHFSASGHSTSIQNDLWVHSYAGKRFENSQKADKETRKQTKHDPHRRQKFNQQLLQALEQEGGGISDDQPHDGLFHCRIPVPSEAQGTKITYKGTKMNTSHSLRVKIKTRSGVTNPEFTIPLTIVPGSLQSASASSSSSSASRSTTVKADYMNPDGSVTVTATKPNPNSPVGIGMGIDEATGGVIITSIKPTSIFLGTKLQKGMRILRVNGTDVTTDSSQLIVGLLKSIATDVTLVAMPPAPLLAAAALEVTSPMISSPSSLSSSSSPQGGMNNLLDGGITVTVTATKPTPNSSVGIGLGYDDGVIITSIKPTSIFVGTQLQKGMKILRVNGTDVTDDSTSSPQLVVGLLQSIARDVTLVAMSPPPTPTALAVTSATASSSQQEGIPLAIARPFHEDHLSGHQQVAPSIFLPSS